MFIGWGLFFHPRVPSLLGAFAFAVCAADVVSIVNRSHWLEWVAVPLLLVFVAQLSYGAWRLAPSRSPSAGQPDAGGRRAATSAGCTLGGVLFAAGALA